MSTDSRNKIEEINNRFYEALNSFDINIMEDVWSNDSTVKCVHPGWPLIKGWDAVKDSWKNIFDSSGFNHVSVSKLFIDHKQDSAWVNCVERISYKFDNQIIITLAQTTNIFEFKDGDWQMVLHHSSPMPVPLSESETESLQ